ncbi:MULTISPECIES: O-succinylhomoserine sulfhydrylase [unclassified Marinobacterium]|uniref:O-succinylhomoserine sulfhydrylase n=1 Tax=unclassified Marinobacterium TaxID=2644139 RepID=UPI0015693C82|nr:MULTISPECIES: O-succinylhomoserine sulfhydrylase [unclassified Marinobacterium]NRP09780.1 O-succinylhomoserine sulfhydrylase [Marinobacterium sp. xm-g-48]NRP14527.1 O-succinylhomoserine sulfhydrylase [Marinobacterium sp. xm-a-152]NRP28045.1 O-succinylhomoserine sulfhydrylase [Marinobacterium sp. xm-d-420]NRP47298.1 O-succinylhomoserine sulfhydrylase [Marinobacterium sp. xm-d-543]NRP51867.1 O-succinylhomoserine sulfhydrylase [Marinobacterium sp. xm-v-242]
MGSKQFERPERIQFSDDHYAVETLAVRAGQWRSEEGEHSDAIFPTSSFVYSSAKEAADTFAGNIEGNVYSRFTNPTVQAFERRIAALEGGERAIATSSGMAGIMSLCLSLMKHGDHVVCSRSVFGSTVSLFEKYVSRAGIETTFVDPKDLTAWQAAVRPTTRMFFLETPSNPLAEVTDIQAVADVAHAAGAKLVVDNCFLTPALQKPLSLGADIVMHSATKHLDGQGRVVGGVVVGSDADMEEVFGFIRTAGSCLSPFNAWVFQKGLETLPLRMRAHSEAALEIAQWLEAQPKVARVYYSGLASHPQHELAARQQSGFGAVLGFEVASDTLSQQEAAWSFIDATEVISITGNLGDVKSTITHPATTTHGRMSAEARAEAGIQDSLIRLSVGLENVDDLKRDLQRGLDAI